MSTTFASFGGDQNTTPSTGGFTSAPKKKSAFDSFGGVEVVAPPVIDPPETYGAWFPAKPETDTVLKTGLKATGNLPSSTYNLAKMFGTMIANPIETVKGIGGLLGEGIGTLGGLGYVKAKEAVGLAPKGTSANYDISTPKFDAVTKYFNDRYGTTIDTQSGGEKNFTWDNLINKMRVTAVNDPVGFGTDIAMLLQGGAGLAGKTAELNKAISPIAKVVTKPVGKVGELFGKTTKYGLSQTTGLNPETISNIVREPSVFSAKAFESASRNELAQTVKSAIDSRLKSLDNRGSAYDDIRTMTTPAIVDRTMIQSVLDKYGIKIEKGKVKTTAESTPLSSADKTSLEDFYGTYGSADTLTPNGFLNVREALTQLAKYDSAKTGNLSQISRDLRATYNETVRPQIAGLKELDAQYAPEVKQLKQIKKDYLTKQGGFKDGAINKIANLTGVGKEQVLGRLKAIIPDVEKRISIVKTAEDIERASGLKVGTYARAGVGLFGATTGNIPALIGAILSSPEIAVRLLRAYGLTKQEIAVVTKALYAIANDIAGFKLPVGVKIDDFLEKYLSLKSGTLSTVRQKVEDYAKNPKLGMGIEDVSKSTDLASQAKGKTLEEFVKGQEKNMVYHGSTVPLKSFNNKSGVFFTDDMMNADGYGIGENVYEGYLNLKNPLTIDAKGRRYDDLKTPYGKSTREIVANVDSKKYDGVVFKNIKDSFSDAEASDQVAGTISYAFRPKDAFLNESQLTDIWKKANEVATEESIFPLYKKPKGKPDTINFGFGEEIRRTPEGDIIPSENIKALFKTSQGLSDFVKKVENSVDGPRLTTKEIEGIYDNFTAGRKSTSYSEPSNLSQEEIKIQESISKKDFEKVVERFFPQVKEFYADQNITNYRDYLNKIDPETIAMELDSYPEPRKAIVDLLDGDWEIQVSDVVDSYRSGSMKDSIQRQPFTVNLESPQDVPIKGKQPFYAPQKRSGDIKKTLEVASQKVVSSNKEAVLSARKDLVFEWATNNKLAEELGITTPELNKKIRNISGLSTESSKTQMRANAGVPEQYHWAGITNSNFLKKNGVELKHIDKMVKSIDDKTAKLGSYQGDSLRSYIMNTFLSIDTRLKYGDLNFKIGQLDRALGEYSNKDLTITIKRQSQNTVSHEIGHYLDYRFARELGIDNSLSAGGYNWDYIQQSRKISPEHIEWAKEYVRFTDSLVKKSEIGYLADRATYLQRPTEVFARFTAKFVDWTAKKSGYNHSELNYYADSFAESDFYSFIKLLQKKGELDAKYKIVPTVEKTSGSVNVGSGKSPI